MQIMESEKQKRVNELNHWVMHPVARVSTNYVTFYIYILWHVNC
jgi:hypothetical protein